MSNRLRHEPSPYLQQHADNPVDWYPWGEEALTRARQEDRPILLSIGYSACHWCHVMAHESFEDPATAEVMNREFVNIKVDREERPDLDRIYQLAFQVLNQRGGGWPLTVFLTPDQTPFFAGTYFPRQERHGLPAFTDLLERIAGIYRERQGDIHAQNAELRQVLESVRPQGDPAAALTAAPLDAARHQLEAEYDGRHGGFGDAPKFPHPTHIERLLRHYVHTRETGRADERAREMALGTLRAMADGGLFDQVGGGFFRYSVDAHWTIPHFEKMLYDNAALLGLYADAHALTGEPDFRRVAEATGEWVLTEMRAPAGGFYASLDADSPGGEGAFYTWTPAEVEAVLGEEERAVAAPVWGLESAANFEGRWHLRMTRPLADVARDLGIDEAEARQRLERARTALAEARDERPRPGRDDKVLTAWNGLMVRGLAVAGARLGRADFVDAAAGAVDFLRDHLLQEGRLAAVFAGGEARESGYLDDYAYLLEGILNLLAVRWRDADLTLARQLAEALLEHFRDTLDGGFFFTADDHEALITRPKTSMDESTPAGAGVAARSLLRLGHLVAEPRYLEAAEEAVKGAGQSIEELPHGHCSLLDALEEILYPPQLVILRGATPAMAPWHRRALADYAPRRQTAAIPEHAADLPEALAARHARGPVTAWVCRGHECHAATDDFGTFEQALAD
ncbi:MAG: thioredoxin domain-containing protein [Thiohalospira sp.]